jgi:gliding motility-associated-like protein
MKKALYILFLFLTLFGCTKSTIKKNGCADPPLTGNLCLPNIFSPNGDGVNDTLFVRQSPGHPQIVGLEFKITDAVGTILFSSTDPKFGWSGSYNGAINSGLFKSEVHASMSNGESIDFNGTVTVLGDRPKTHLINQCSECRFDSQFDGNGGFDANLPTNETSAICE